jgi:hypothetical protein
MWSAPALEGSFVASVTVPKCRKARSEVLRADFDGPAPRNQIIELVHLRVGQGDGPVRPIDEAMKSAEPSETILDALNHKSGRLVRQTVWRPAHDLRGSDRRQAWPQVQATSGIP